MRRSVQPFESKAMKLRKILIIASLASFGAFTQQALAEPENCSAKFNYCIRNGEKLASAAPCSKAENACENSGNGKTTTVVVTDGTGTHQYTVRQGVPTENGQMILAPNGVRYNVSDPELGRQLEKAGLVDGKGSAIAYVNPKTAKNEYALARDKVVRDRAIATGGPIPKPTGTSRDTPFTKPPTVNDHRTATPNPVAPSGPPPAAAAGTVSTTPVTNPNVMSGAVRDHRRKIN